MVNQSPKKQHRRPEPLASRHIFLDTQVYRALGYSPSNPAMTSLKAQITSHRVALHITDITLLEVKRQIREGVLKRQRELRGIEKDLSRWRKRAPKAAPNGPIDFDAEALSTELFQQFERFLRYECEAQVHRALEIDPAVIFGTYFDRKPPFDGEISKEFPDAFVVEALSQWCREQDDRMHVVTEDKAMTRAVLADERLPAMKGIHEVLARAAADLGADGETAAEAVLNRPAFDSSLEAALRPQMKEVGYVYVGDLIEGEAYEGELLSIEEICDWSVVGLSDRRVTLIIDANLRVRVEVGFEDREHAIYDREDDRWFGAEIASTKIDDAIEVEILVDVDRRTGTVREAKVLTQEVEVTGPSDC
jgi:hypothetical protein